MQITDVFELPPQLARMQIFYSVVTECAPVDRSWDFGLMDPGAAVDIAAMLLPVLNLFCMSSRGLHRQESGDINSAEQFIFSGPEVCVTELVVIWLQTHFQTWTIKYVKV